MATKRKAIKRKAIKAKNMGLHVIQEQDLKSDHFVSKLKNLDADLFQSRVTGKVLCKGDKL